MKTVIAAAPFSRKTAAGIVPTGFYRHFSDMDQLGLALVSEVGQTFRETIRLVRHNELFMGGVINASVRIFLDIVEAVQWVVVGFSHAGPLKQ